MKPKLFRKVLKNGMTVIHEKRDSSVVSVAYAVRYGGINEQIPEKGIAHFIEHMLYKGNKKMGTKEISEAFERRGGIMNGFTDEQMTAFWVKAPMKHFLEIFKVLTEMVKNPDFDEKEMDKERKVIFEEIKMRNDNPRLFAMEKIKTQLYDGHFAFDVIGTFESLSSVDRKKIVEKFKRIYQTKKKATPRKFLHALWVEVFHQDSFSRYGKKETLHIPSVRIVLLKKILAILLFMPEQQKKKWKMRKN